MKNKIIISTGNFWDGKNPLDNIEAIKNIRKLDVDGIELSFVDPAYLEGFYSHDVGNLLRKFKTVGMHLPAIKYQKNDKVREIIKKCFCIYQLIKADYAVIHLNWLKDPDLFRGTRWNIVIENGGSKHGILVKDMHSFLKKHRRFKMVLDVNHAYESDEIDEYVKKLKNKIFAVHLGGGEMKNIPMHIPFFKAPQKYRDACEPIKKLDCPVVLEYAFPKEQSQIDSEIQRIKNWLKA
jgi:sugar phosphate isomerase/epimerase